MKLAEKKKKIEEPAIKELMRQRKKEKNKKLQNLIEAK